MLLSAPVPIIVSPLMMLLTPGGIGRGGIIPAPPTPPTGSGGGGMGGLIGTGTAPGGGTPGGGGG